MDHAAYTAELARQIVASPDDEAAWLAFAADLADNGYDGEADVVRTFWPALRDTLATCESFAALMAQVRQNLRLIHSAAAHVSQNNPPD